MAIVFSDFVCLKIFYEGHYVQWIKNNNQKSAYFMIILNSANYKTKLYYTTDT
jgi:hypothetical protein